MINKKAQEEMVGFVMIILLVSVIFLVFLGIYLRQGPSDNTAQNAEVSQFLDVLTEVTTTCEIASTRRSVQYLLKKDPEHPCTNDVGKIGDILEEVINASIESSWNFGADSPTQSYSFKTTNNLTIAFNPFTCERAQSIKATKKISDNLTIELTICKSKL